MIETALTIVELAGVLSTLNDTKDFAKWLRGRLGADNPALQPDEQKERLEVLAAAVERLQEIEKEREAVAEADRAKLRDLEDVVFQRVVRNAALEGIREPTPERKRMLAYLMADSIADVAPIELVSRIERTIRDLDPFDLLLLDDIANYGRQLSEGILRQSFRDPEKVMHFDFLITAGCVRLQTGGWGGVNPIEITPLGYAIRRHMAGFVRVLRVEGAQPFFMAE